MLFVRILYSQFPRYMCFCFFCRNSRWPQKWRENNFWEKSVDDSTGTLGGQNALSRTVSEVNAFLHFTQKFKMAAKNGEKNFLGKVAK